jgi:hypothetical protein
LLWSSPSQSKQVVPQSQLYPTVSVLGTTAYADATLLGDQGTIYVMEFGLKRPIASMNVFTALGYRLDNVNYVDTQSIPLGAAITSAQTRHVRGTLVNHKGTLYFIGKDLKYPFPNMDVLHSWGVDLDQVVPANSYDLVLPTGLVVEKKN